MKSKYTIAKYLRLSSEDGDKPESNSIANQRNLVDYHINKLFAGKSIETIELIDDGYSGTNMNRPSIKKLLVLAETHVVDCIIVKDFSRFARDYIEVGRYVEQEFPKWQIRFISINDNYDSRDYSGITGGIDVALKNITYTMYSMDLSEKIKSARKTLYKQGKHIAPHAFFGYKKDPADKHRIIIDEPAAEVVRRLFELRSNGISATEIARILNNDRILTPAQYKRAQFPDCGTWSRFDDYKQWTSSMVRGLLRDERYTGKYIGARNEMIAVGSRKHRRLKTDDRVEIENAHEAIISKELFQAVQPDIHGGTRDKSDKGILRGLVCCGGCSHKMAAYGTAQIKYYCSYRAYSDYNNCCKNTVSDDELTEIVTEAIKHEIEKSGAADMANKEIKRKLYSHMNEADNLRRKIEDNKAKRIKYYMSFSKGEYSESNFDTALQLIADESEKLKKELTALETTISEIKNLSYETIFSKYKECARIDRRIIRELVKSVYVYADKRIKIIWNFKE